MNPFEPEQVKYETVNLHVKKVAASVLVDYYDVRLMNLETIAEHVGEALAIKLASKILAQPLPVIEEEISVEYPADWYQHFRQRWYPKSWLERYPVKMVKQTRKITIEPEALYPEVVWKDERHIVVARPPHKSTKYEFYYDK